MKPISSFKLLSLWLIAIVFALAQGCGGYKSQAKDREGKVARADKPVTSKKTGKPEEKIFVEEEGEVLVLRTPSGYSKRQIELPIKEPKEIVPVKKVPSLPSAKREIAEVSPLPAVKQAQLIPKTTMGPKKKEVPADYSQRIILNFDNADLYEVINTIAELLGINYIVDPNVKGTVTIHTSGGLSKNDLFPVFLQILEVNGLTAIKEGNLYKIVELKDAPRRAISILGGEDVQPTEKTIIQIVPLRFISVQEMTKLLTPFVSDGGTLVSDVNSNTLLVVDKGLNILKVLRLVEAFDVNMFEKVHYRFYRLEYLDAEEVEKILSGFSTSFGTVANVFVKFIAISRLNTLLAVSSSPLIFEKIEEIIRQIDVVIEEAEPRIHVYFVKNGEAEDLADILNSIFLKSPSAKEKKEGTRRKAGGVAGISANPFSQSRIREKEREKARAKQVEPEAVKKATPRKQEEGKGSETLKDEVNITPDEVRNALIIEATPRDYQIIENLLRRIDVLPRQVLIEATIAEITRNSATDIGINWALGRGAAFDSAGKDVSGFMASVGSAGLKYSIGVTDKWYAELNALASEGKVNILSSPHVLASDNKEARIDVSREIPIASSEWTYASYAQPITQTNIQYRDTGVILSVTPHINERGLVTMDINEEVSDLEKKGVTVAGIDYPSFFKRMVNTSLTVKHGQTVAIGGLIRDKEEEGISGLPCLINIPLVRFLFGKWGTTTEKLELIVLITPRVIVDISDVDEVTEEFKSRVGQVMQLFTGKGR
jgi:general secretion pathway protein D